MPVDSIFFSFPLSFFSFFSNALYARAFWPRIRCGYKTSWNAWLLSPLASSFFIFFVFRGIRGVERKREGETGGGGGAEERKSRLVHTRSLLSRAGVIALIKRYILWTTRYNSGAKSCVLLHDKRGNWQALMLLLSRQQCGWVTPVVQKNRG